MKLLGLSRYLDIMTLIEILEVQSLRLLILKYRP